MIEVALWLLRWAIAGAALSASILAFAYVLEMKERAIGLSVFRATLLALLAAPMIALVPPIFTFSAPGTAPAETTRLVSRFIEKKAQELAHDATTAGQPHQPSAAPGVVDALAAALVALWIAGAATAAIAYQRSRARLSRSFRDGAPFPTSFVECRLAADVAGPLLFGVWRPRMLAPSDFHEWPDIEREAVLRHEEAHARHGDLIWAFVGDVVRIAYWWVPPVRFLVSRHMLVTEEDCDAVSFARGEDRHDYARALLAVAGRVGGHRSPGLAMTASSLGRRIERILLPPTRSAFGVPMLVASAAASFTLALSGPAAAGPDPFRIYVFDGASGVSSTYAISDGARAMAAVVERCAARVILDASAIVDRFEARIQSRGPDKLRTMWTPGPISKIELGPCRPEPPRDADSLVLMVDASEKQARDFISQIGTLSRSQQREMTAALGLN